MQHGLGDVQRRVEHRAVVELAGICGELGCGPLVRCVQLLLLQQEGLASQRVAQAALVAVLEDQADLKQNDTKTVKGFTLNGMNE